MVRQFDYISYFSIAILFSRPFFCFDARIHVPATTPNRAIHLGIHFSLRLRYELYIRPPDLYGRGYSDAPSVTYDVNLYTTQLALLLQYIGWEKAHIVGFSMVRMAVVRHVLLACWIYAF